MRNRVRDCVAVILKPAHLRRTGLIALVIGTWLTSFNEGDVLLQGVWSSALAVKIALNYLTPFTVSNIGLLARVTTPES